MEEKIISPFELKLTFIHSKNNEKKIETWSWLEENYLKGNLEEILNPIESVLKNDGCGRMYFEDKVSSITAAQDPGDLRLLVYDGNIRTLHARKRKYNVKVKIMKDQSDLEEYINNFEIKWFGIDEFGELIKFMRIYADYPYEDSFIDSSFNFIRRLCPELRLFGFDIFKDFLYILQSFLPGQMPFTTRKMLHNKYMEWERMQEKDFWPNFWYDDDD
ncbi:MAG: hypothetical protein QXW97_01135 [Candidatus Pacearchaeota archaeon]